MKRIATLITALGALAASSMPSQAGATFDAIMARGELKCGTSTGTSIGKSTLSDTGEWNGFEVDYCRALAAALFGDGQKVSFVPLEFKNAFAALTSSSVDILARSATWTFSRDTDLKFDWAGIYLYDGQGFLVNKSLGIKNASELNGASICVSAGTTTELNLADYFRTKGMEYTPIVVNSPDQSIANLDANRCDAYTNEVGGLASYRLGLANPDDFVILPDIISKEPLGPLVRQDDAQFEDIARWTLFALTTAEEFGINQANVAEIAATSDNPQIQRFLGTSGEFGAMMGLPNDWAVQIVKAVGNYGEMFERNLGSESPVKLGRGVNRLWNDGGLLYAPPVR